MTILDLFSTIVALSIGYLISVLANRKIPLLTVFAFIFSFAVILAWTESYFFQPKAISNINETYGTYLCEVENDKGELAEVALIEIFPTSDGETMLKGVSYLPGFYKCGNFTSCKVKFDGNNNIIKYYYKGSEGGDLIHKKRHGYIEIPIISSCGDNSGNGKFFDPDENSFNLKRIDKGLIINDNIDENYEIIANHISKNWLESHELYGCITNDNHDLGKCPSQSVLNRKEVEKKYKARKEYSNEKLQKDSSELNKRNENITMDENQVEKESMVYTKSEPQNTDSSTSNEIKKVRK